MQQSSMILFCDECGAANVAGATICVACQYSLSSAPAALFVQPPLLPVKVGLPVVREVVAGSGVMPGSQGMPVDFQPGMVLAGRYCIREEIGRGGFSIVYCAEDLTSHAPRFVAIKRIHLSALSSRQIIDATETFNREVSMLSRFQEIPGIPEFYDYFTDPENWYLVMAYIDGQTLEEYMQHEPGGYLSELETLEVGIALASILQDLHWANPPVIFRDLKPANIIVTPARTLSLVDFGIARVFTTGKKKDTTPLGSPGYAPPEQYGRAQTDGRADIYSLGATLSTLLTGCDPLELGQGGLSHNPDPPSRSLRYLLAAMMEPDVAQRPATIGRVHQRLVWIRRRKYWPMLLKEELQRRSNGAKVWWQNGVKQAVSTWRNRMGPDAARGYLSSVSAVLITIMIEIVIHPFKERNSTLGAIFFSSTVWCIMFTVYLKKNRKRLPLYLGILTVVLLFVLVSWLLHIPLQ